MLPSCEITSSTAYTIGFRQSSNRHVILSSIMYMLLKFLGNSLNIISSKKKLGVGGGVECTNIPHYSLGKERYESLKKHYIACGLTTRQHSNKRRRPHNALSFAEIKRLVKFIENYAEDHAILLPGRIPGYKRDNLQLLPSNTTKKVFTTRLNKTCIQLPQLHAGCVDPVQNRLFRWAVQGCSIQHVLHSLAEVDTQHNAYEDLYWVCQQNSTALMRSANTPEEQTSEVQSNNLQMEHTGTGFRIETAGELSCVLNLIYSIQSVLI